MADGDDDATPVPAAATQPPLDKTPPPPPAGTPPAAPAVPAAPTPPQFQSHTDDILRQQRALGEQEADIYKRRSEELDPLIKDYQRSAGRPAPGAPKLDKQKQFESPGQEATWKWAEAAALVGAIAGAFGRAGATTGLNAIAAMNQGLHEGNVENYNNAYKEWKAASEQTKEINENKIKEYKMVLDSRHYDLEQKSAMIELVANKYRDEAMAQAAQQKNFTLQSEIVQKGDEAQNRWNENQEKIIDNHNMMVSRLFKQGSPEWMEYMRGLKETDPEAYEENLKILRETNPKLQQQQQEKAVADAKPIADAIMSGEHPPNYTGLSRATATAVDVELAKRGADLNKMQLQYGQTKKMINSLNSPQQLRLAQVLQQADLQINRVRQLADQLDMTDFKFWNEKKMQAEVNANPGSAKLALVRQYLSSVAALRGDISQVESGGYAPTEASWGAANKQLDEADDVRTMNAALDEIKRITAFRLQAMQSFGGQTQDNPYSKKVLPPPAQELPAGSGAVAGPGAPSGGGAPPPPPGFTVGQ
jgi:hypothetical protein